ncbi:MAG: hypothetical protein MUE54_04335 [Anaerolineae bacterium]|nr:hypothetical protein [Anaerolineae bacterium]
MTRNIRDELMTAIFVLGGIMLAIVGVIALSTSSPTPDVAVPTTVSMVEESPVNPTPSPTAIDATAQTVINTSTSSANTTPTLSALQSSALATLTAFAAIPTRTHTLSPTPTNTFIVPTATPRILITPIATVTTRPTNTVVPPSATTNPTNTPIPPTETPPPTNTLVPATNTPRPTNTPISPTETPPPTNTPNATATSALPPILLSAEGCLNPSIQITFPQPNQRLTESFEVIGTATLPNFGLYRIEIRPDSALTYQRVVGAQQVIYADVLAEIDPNQYPDGIYWIRLVVVDNRGNIAENGTCAIPTLFE